MHTSSSSKTHKDRKKRKKKNMDVKQTSKMYKKEKYSIAVEDTEVVATHRNTLPNNDEQSPFSGNVRADDAKSSEVAITKDQQELEKRKKKKKEKKKKEKKKKRKHESKYEKEQSRTKRQKYQTDEVDRKKTKKDDNDAWQEMMNSQGVDDDNNNNNVAPALEGCMVSDNILVLLDRSLGKVYSGLERLENGDLKPIGKIQNGEIVLDNEDKNKNDCENIQSEEEKASSKDAAKVTMTKSKATTNKEVVTSATSALQSPPTFPFDTDPDDHCESPLQAYRDILPLLVLCGCSGGRESSTSDNTPSIYDPYYCNGAVIDNLKGLGLSKVYNHKEDCYQIWSNAAAAAAGGNKANKKIKGGHNDEQENYGKYPEFDIMVTNPPYSGDHIERLIDHVVTSSQFGQRPWFLLLPQWVHKKQYYIERTKNIRPFYIVPQKRYVYVPPPSFRKSKKSDVHKKSSPFCSMWYVWGGTNELTERLISKAYQIPSCDVARSKSALRDLRRKGGGKKKKM